MKTLVSLVLCALMALPLSAQKAFKFEAKVAGDVPQKFYVYVAGDDYKMPSTPTDSVSVKNGKIKYEVKVASFRPISLRGDGYDIDVYAMPGGKCQVDVQKEEYHVSGDTFQQQYGAADDNYSTLVTNFSKVVEKIRAIPESNKEEYEKAYAEGVKCQNETIDSLNSYLKAHSSEEGTVMFYLKKFDPQDVLKETSESVKNGQCSKYITYVEQEAKVKKEAQEKAAAAAKEASAKTGEGVMFTDFSAEYEGKTTKLSDYVGKGKYVLVDFWASWCGPCKAEIPNIIATWEKHHGDKFEVLGVATWDKPEATLKSIEALHIPYPQMLNAQKAGSDAYGIQGIPQIILFGPDGTILKRNLRGEAIEQTVSEYLSK